MELIQNRNKDFLDIIRNSSKLNNAFSDKEFEELWNYFDFLTFRSQEVLLKDGAPADRLGLIIEGRAEYVVDSHKIVNLEVGDVFGESAFAREGTVRGDVIARTNTLCGIMTIKKYDQLLEDSPHLARHLRYFVDSIINERRNHLERIFYKDTTQYIALIAHDTKKDAMINFVKNNRSFFERFAIVATDSTGSRLYEEVGITLTRKVSAGPLGGDQAIGAMVAADNILAVFFFRDPLSPHAHHADIEALGRLCDVYDVPFATNVATASAILNEFTFHKPLPY